MRRRRSPAGRVGCAVALLAAAALTSTTAAAVAATGCRPHADAQVRFDDGRLLVEAAEREVDPRNVRERWWSCWRPNGRRTLIEDRRHLDGRDETSLLAVRRGRFVVLAGPGALDVHDARRGRRTARVDHVGVVRELVVTAAGRVAVTQDEGSSRRVLLAGSGRRSCLLDAAVPDLPEGPLGDLFVRKEQLGWFNHGVRMGEDLTSLRC